MTDRLIIAEIGSCNGDLQLAIDTAQAAIEAGAWMVKGQMFTADTLVADYAVPYGRGITEPATQREAFQNALDPDDWWTVAESVDGRFFASVFDPMFCDDYPYEWIKIASADITYRSLIEAAAASKARLMLSTGGAYRWEISRALQWAGRDVDAILACTLSYPTDNQDANLARIPHLRTLYGDRVGWSDHTRGTIVADTAFHVGAKWVEKHFTIRPGTGGDHDFGIGPEQLQRLRVPQGRLEDRDLPGLLGSPVLRPSAAEAEALIGARRSWHTIADVPKGEPFTGKVAALRPAVGIDPDQTLDGLVASAYIAAGTALSGELMEHKPPPEDVLVPAVLAAKLDLLSVRERQILEARFGLVDGIQRTFEEIGEELDITRERVRQIEKKALAKLLHASGVDGRPRNPEEWVAANVE